MNPLLGDGLPRPNGHGYDEFVLAYGERCTAAAYCGYTLRISDFLQLFDAAPNATEDISFRGV